MDHSFSAAIDHKIDELPEGVLKQIHILRIKYQNQGMEIM